MPCFAVPYKEGEPVLHAIPGDQTKHVLTKDCACKPRISLRYGNVFAEHKDPEWSWTKVVEVKLKV